MINRWRLIVSGIGFSGIGLLLLTATGAHALQPADTVGNFRLFDQSGDSHHLHYFSHKKAVVLMVQDNSCAASTDALPALGELQNKFADEAQFFVITPTENRNGAQKIAELTNGKISTLVDDAQVVGRTLGLIKSGEVLVVDTSNWSLAYRGGVNDVEKALTALGSSGSMPTSMKGPGCDIVYAPHDGTSVSYSETIAPILAENCVSCHRPGGIGPWAMTDHNMVRGFSMMIREVLLTKRMPPWHADPAIGHWENDRSLSREKLQTLISWIDAGSPRGEGLDPLTQYASAKPVWGDLGEPDLIVDIPPTEVPATGVVDYKYKYVTNPLDRDVWVRASQIVPGDRAVLHHVITRFGELVTEGPHKGRISNRGIGGGLAGYVPGADPRPMPEGTGTFLPAGATIEFQMHYTTSGVPTTDHSRIGIYFHDEKPEYPIKAMVLANPRLQIPAHASNHSEVTMREFDTDVLAYSLLPHSHYRGKAARFVAHYPDGTSETLLNVPNYDFNWQTTYRLKEPKFMPAGTKIVYTNWWDNSAQNPANPNPAREVRWGRQSFDEMIFGVVSYREIKADEGDQIAGSE